LAPSPPPCGVVVGDEILFHAEGELLCFDDSLLHSAFNLSTQPRVVLIFDVARPDGCSPGSADKGNTVELEDFIRSFH
jgi:aspartyl/asparaginyl beta-hydroxylase (cupin superfamily)